MLWELYGSSMGQRSHVTKYSPLQLVLSTRQLEIAFSQDIDFPSFYYLVYSIDKVEIGCSLLLQGSAIDSIATGMQACCACHRKSAAARTSQE